MVRKLVFFVLVLALAVGSAQAVVTTWTGTLSTEWNNPGNWDNGVPNMGIGIDNTHILSGPNMPLIGPGVNAFTATGDTWGPEWGSTLNIEGGSYSGTAFCGLVPVAAADAPSTINIGKNGTGGSISIVNMLLGDNWWFRSAPFVNYNQYSGTSVANDWIWLGGHMNLYGGETTAMNGMNIAAGGDANFQNPTNTNVNIYAPNLDGNGGILSLPDSYYTSGQISTWISQGYITSPNGTLVFDEVTAPGRVLISAVPEPSTIILLCLGLLGGLALIRRNRS